MEGHFDYLLQAFQDERYIYIDDKPLFIIYRPGHIPDCEKMLNYWNALARENGLKGIYFAETLNSFPLPNINGFDASIQFEPFYTIAHDSSSDINKVIYDSDMQLNVWDYDKVWMYILQRSLPKKKTFPGAFVDWDNTARRKNANSSIFVGSTPEKFTIYLSKQIHRTYSFYNSEFLFINAWNEWAEGTYLEPDKKYGFSYLEGVKNAIDRGMKAYKKDESF